ncbi:MAG: KOW domain-containing protein [Clostridia bacterium]
MKISDVVISKKGKYDGEVFFVIDVKDGFAYLCDGKKRKVSNPKKKNILHLEKTNLSSPIVAERLQSGENTVDALMRAELKRLKFMLESKVSD